MGGADADAGPANEEAQVAAVEDAWLAAEVAHDEAFLRRVMDDRYTVNRRNGTTLGKEEFSQRAQQMTSDATQGAFDTPARRRLTIIETVNRSS